jgi:hypothetical protein
MPRLGGGFRVSAEINYSGGSELAEWGNDLGVEDEAQVEGDLG